MKCSHCDRPATNKLRGLCHMHYGRQRRGQPLDDPPRYGGRVKYQMAHLRVKALWGPAKSHRCVKCSSPAVEWACDGTDPSELREVHNGSDMAYSLYPEFYKPLCIQCHKNEDNARAGRIRKPCNLNGCNKPRHAKGLCNTHYLGQKRGFKPNYRLLGS